MQQCPAVTQWALPTHQRVPEQVVNLINIYAVLLVSHNLHIVIAKQNVSSHNRGWECKELNIM